MIVTKLANNRPEFRKILSKIKVNDRRIFSPDEVDYLLDCNGERATIEGLGNHSLEPGENEISITVTSESSEPRVYVITVNRALIEDEHTSEIRKIEITGTTGTQTVYVYKDIYNYDITIAYTDISLQVNAYLYDK